MGHESSQDSQEMFHTCKPLLTIEDARQQGFQAHQLELRVSSDLRARAMARGRRARPREGLVLWSARFACVFQACERKAIDKYWRLFTICALSLWSVATIERLFLGPGGASKSADDYDDYEYYSSADIFLPPECFAADSFRVVGETVS